MTAPPAAPETQIAAGPPGGPFRGITLKVASVCAFVIMATMLKATMTIPSGQMVFFRSFFAMLPVLAWLAWKDAKAGSWPLNYPEPLKREYDLATIRKWLEVFLFRFFQISQFKRSAIPNSPKVSAGGALSPRGDWRAPSDGTADPWLEELKQAFDE